MDFERIYEGIKKGFKMLGEIGMIAGGAVTIIAIGAIVFGIIINSLATLSILPNATQDAIDALATAYNSLITTLISAFGIAAGLVILAVVIVVFAFALSGKKKSNKAKGGNLGY